MEGLVVLFLVNAVCTFMVFRYSLGVARRLADLTRVVDELESKTRKCLIREDLDTVSRDLRDHIRKLSTADAAAVSRDEFERHVSHCEEGRSIGINLANALHDIHGAIGKALFQRPGRL